MPFLDWISEYRGELNKKTTPYFKELGLMEATPAPNAPQTAPNATGTASKANPAPTQPTVPATPEPPVNDPNEVMKRIDAIKATLHQALISEAQEVDAAMSAAFKTFKGKMANPEDKKKEIDSELKKIWEKEYLDAYKYSKFKGVDENDQSQEDKRVEQATKKANKALKEYTGDSDFEYEPEKSTKRVGGGLGVFGESADSVRLAKAIVIRIICFEGLGIILGAPSELSTISLASELKNVKEKESKDAEEKSKKRDEQVDKEANEKIDKQFLTKEDEFIAVIDGMRIIINENAITGTAKNLAGKAATSIFSGVSSIANHSSMVKLAKNDSNKLGDFMVRWYLTTASFSTRLFNGHNALAIVDGITQGYLSKLNTHSKTFIKNLFYKKLPPAFEPSQMSYEEFEKQIKKNAEKFKVASNPKVVNRIMSEILQAFQVSGRL